MKKSRILTQEETGILIALLAFIFGGWTRLLIPSMAGFPVNDGGLFYLMVRAIQTNGLRIPPTVQYNGISIPFAYPPLGFYVGAIISSLFHIDVIQVLQWLPGVVLIGTLPAFYVLAKAILKSSFRAGLATLIYAFTPRAITWQIMGGGLTRSFGQLFLLLALACIYQAFTNYNWKSLLLSILFSTLVVLVHPEAALQAVGMSVLFWIFHGRTREGTRNAIIIGAGTILLAAIWWLPLVFRSGINALISAGQTGFNNGYALLQPLLFNFTEEPLMTLIAVLGVIGLAIETSKLEFLTPIWFFLPFVVEPRSAPTVAMIPLALLAGIALSDVILPALAGSYRTRPQPQSDNFFQSRAVQIFLLFIGLYMLGNVAYFGSELVGSTLSVPNRQAFKWIQSNTPADSKFLILTGNTSLFCDSTQEWFPALTHRISVATIQGKEWSNGEKFIQTARNSIAVQACLSSTMPLDCIEKLASSPNNLLEFDYLYLTRQAPVVTDCRATGISMPGERLIAILNQDKRYQPVYQTDEVDIFSLQH